MAVLVSPRPAFDSLFGTGECLAEARRVIRLEQVIDGMHVEGADRVLVEGGDEHDRRQRRFFEPLQNAEPVEVGHLHVEEDHLGPKCADTRNGVPAARALGHDLCLAGFLEEPHEPAPRDVLVVNDDDGNHEVVSEEELTVVPTRRSSLVRLRARDCSR